MSIRKRGKHAYQVRVLPFPAKTLPTMTAARKFELELLHRRAQGDLYVEKPQTLRLEIETWLARHRAVAGARKPTLRFYEQSARVWLEAFGDVRVSALRRAPIEDFNAGRAAEHPRAAKNELEFLKRVLRDARSRGQRVDEGVFAVPAVKHSPREGRALTVEQLYELASWFPECVKRLVLLAGMVGARQRVWFEMTDELLDLSNGTLSIPSWLSKNRKPHQVFLAPTEVQLFREQLMARARGASLVFPTPTGKQWTESGFRERVWSKAVAAAVKNDPAGERSMFLGFNFHQLRHTACSLMATAGMDPAVAAERAGHSDGGALFLRRYRHLYEAEKRVQALRLDAFIRASLDGSWTDDAAGAEIPLNQAEDEDGRNLQLRKPRGSRRRTA